jgi:aminopeptidase 2
VLDAQLSYQLTIARVQVLPLYEQTFDIEYPLPKLDTLIADDFDLCERSHNIAPS